MPDLVLTHGYFMGEDPKELQIRKPYPPLGLLYVCSHLRARGFDVDIFDTTFLTKVELFSYMHNVRPSVLGVYANLMTRRNVIEILQVAREAGWQTVVGGPEPGAYIREYLQEGADVVVLGEGEVTMEELLHTLQRGAAAPNDLRKIRGIAFINEVGAVEQTSPRPQIPDLDAQPWPAREAIDIMRYVRTWREAHGQGSLSFITARGCPYHCRWCSHQVFGKTHRRRSPGGVVDEVEWLLSTHEPDMMWIADDVFTIHHGWLREYAAEMRRRGLRVPFECISRADRLNSEAIHLLAELGCFRVWIGSESGSQRILDAMERGVTVAQVQTAVELCKNNGIQTGMFLMWGYEGETLSDIEATIDHVKRAKPDVFLTTLAYPIKGTPYYEQVANAVVQKKSWSQTSDREIGIAGRRSRNFYDCADQLLRDEVELSRMNHTQKDDEAKRSAITLRIRTSREALALRAHEVET